jgi:hypothetical protein
LIIPNLRNVLISSALGELKKNPKGNARDPVS